MAVWMAHHSVDTTVVTKAQRWVAKWDAFEVSEKADQWVYLTVALTAVRWVRLTVA